MLMGLMVVLMLAVSGLLWVALLVLSLSAV
jgi:hypothetical protein